MCGGWNSLELWISPQFRRRSVIVINTAATTAYSFQPLGGMRSGNGEVVVCKFLENPPWTPDTCSSVTHFNLCLHRFMKLLSEGVGDGIELVGWYSIGSCTTHQTLIKKLLKICEMSLFVRLSEPAAKPCIITYEWQTIEGICRLIFFPVAFSIQQVDVVEDLFSWLPPELLSCIYSFMALKDSGQTCCTSKSMQMFWFSSARFKLDLYDVCGDDIYSRRSSQLEAQVAKFTNWINDVLASHKRAVERENHPMKSLENSMPLCNTLQTDFNNWIEYAIRAGVVHLDVRLYNYYNSCMFPTIQGNSKKLESLFLVGVNLTRDIIISLLPKLRSLNHLKLSSDRLDRVEICGVSKLTRVEILCYPNVLRVSVKDSKLESLILTWLSRVEVMVLRHNQSLCCVKVASWLPSPITIRLSHCLVGYVSTVTSLTLDITYHQVVKNQWSRVKRDHEQSLDSGRSLPLQKLTTVELHGYKGKHDENEILNYLFKHVWAPKYKVVFGLCFFTLRDVPTENHSYDKVDDDAKLIALLRDAATLDCV